MKRKDNYQNKRMARDIDVVNINETGTSKTKRDRLAEALRANLKKRKVQKRERTLDEKLLSINNQMKK